MAVFTIVKMIGILLFMGVALLSYFMFMKPYNHWTKREVPTGKFTPVVEDLLYLLLRRESFLDMVQRMYNKLPNARYIGTYQLRSPMFLLKSPELIKQICVKDFDHFMDRRSILPANDDILSKNLAALKGQTWKNMRSTLSPSFTSSKMKSMFFLMCHNANTFVQHFTAKPEEVIEVEMKDTFTRFTIDVIASAAFGIEVDSLKDRDNEFYVMGTSSNDFSSLSKMLAFFSYLAFPKIAKFFRVPILDRKVNSFFMNIVKDTMKMRKERNIKRPDMLGLLIEAKEGKHSENIVDDTKEASFAVVQEHLEKKSFKHNLTDADIASQVFVFFFAGFETVSNAMCFLAYELAINPDVQKKLIDEIDENRPLDGTPTYDTIATMTYLDMVISESLRKWPLAPAMDRVVTKPYIVQPELPHEKPVHLAIDDIISIPIFSLHHDPQYYNNPEKFDPERFSPENRRNIDPYTYLPFGLGPRNCIGSRFALLEIKAVFFYLLTHFEIVPEEKTNIPIKIKKSPFNFSSENGFPLALKKR